MTDVDALAAREAMLVARVEARLGEGSVSRSDDFVPSATAALLKWLLPQIGGEAFHEGQAAGRRLVGLAMAGEAGAQVDRAVRHLNVLWADARGVGAAGASRSRESMTEEQRSDHVSAAVAALMTAVRLVDESRARTVAGGLPWQRASGEYALFSWHRLAGTGGEVRRMALTTVRDQFRDGVELAMIDGSLRLLERAADIADLSQPTPSFMAYAGGPADRVRDALKPLRYDRRSYLDTPAADPDRWYDNDPVPGLASLAQDAAHLNEVRGERMLRDARVPGNLDVYQLGPVLDAPLTRREDARLLRGAAADLRREWPNAAALDIAWAASRLHPLSRAWAQHGLVNTSATREARAEIVPRLKASRPSAVGTWGAPRTSSTAARRATT